MTKTTSISAIHHHTSTLDFITALVGCSKSQIKKYKLSKNFLRREIKSKATITLPIDLVNQNMINPRYKGPSIDTVHEDDDLLVLYKPYNIHTHPQHYDEHDNCLSFIRNYHADAGSVLNVNASQFDRGCLNRLDYTTSGILIYLKDNTVLNTLRENFTTAVTEKVYLAICHGRWESTEEECFEHTITSSGPKGHKQKLWDENAASKPASRATLRAKRIRYDSDNDLSLVAVKLQTGLRHQIRVQLALLNHPILGDSLYAGEKAQRLFLHAYRYTLVINGIEQSFAATDPPLFDLFFKDLDSIF